MEVPSSQKTENGEHNSKTIEVRICKMKRSKTNYDPRLGEGALNQQEDLFWNKKNKCSIKMQYKKKILCCVQKQT